MLKFQDPENPGESILTRDLFANQETLVLRKKELKEKTELLEQKKVENEQKIKEL